MEKSFEELMSELEQITKELESNSCTLSELIEKHQRGTELCNICNNKLKEAQEILVKKIEG